MEHLLVKATIAAATDEGAFTAVISTVAIDRDRDIVEPAAVVEALQKWAPTGKKVPLSWNHSVAAEDIIGNVDPATAKTAGGEVIVDGWVDQSIDRGQHAWRLVKSGTLGFSYGYLVTKADKRNGGGLHIKGLDIFEVTATPIPANADTRVVSWKSVDRDDLLKENEELKAQLKSLQDQKDADVTDKEPTARSVDQLRRQSDELAMSVVRGTVPAPSPSKSRAPRQDDDLRRRSRELMLSLLSQETPK